MKVLFIGGTGLISTAVTKLSSKRDMDLYILNRGNRNHDLPDHVHPIQGDIYDVDNMKKILNDLSFDVVVEWIGFTVEHVMRDYTLFKGKTKQYVFISTAAAYVKPVPFLPVTEDTPLGNQYWEYGRNKQKCEEYLMNLNDPSFHVTIIRPSHTYDDRALIFQIPNYAYPYTLLYRMIHDLPIVLVGDGNTKWTLTHHEDFAEAFLDILGNEKTYHQAYHLTSEFVYTWNEITMSLYNALSKQPNIIYLPYEIIEKHFPEFEGALIGDNMNDAIFDNSKIKKVTPHYQSTIDYRDVAKKAVFYYLNHLEAQVIDESYMKRYDDLVKEYNNIMKK